MRDSPTSPPSPAVLSPRDRYADAVRARRAELREAADLLGGTHRAELRSELALARISESDALGTALGRAVREVRAYTDGADRARRAALPALLGPALDALADGVHADRAPPLRAALRRIATARSLAMEHDWPVLPQPRRPVVGPITPTPVRPARSLLTGALHGVALWRLALLPLVVLPLLGLPVVSGPALIPLAVGAGAVGLVAAVRSRRVVLERAALRSCAEEVFAAARTALDADLGRRMLELERMLGADLDRAVARRRAVLAPESRALAPDAVPEESRASTA